MENITRENLYKQFFDTTVGRFYTEEQSFKLLRLFALESGLKEGSDEYNTVVNTIKAIDKANIKSLIESKNFDLLCIINAPSAEMRLAASALAQCYKSRAENEVSSYASDLEWRVSVYRNINSNEAKLEAAYIEYASGNTSEAIEAFKSLLGSGSLTALSHLAIISYDIGKYADAYRYFSMIHKIYTGELHMPSVKWVEELKNYSALFLTQETISKLDDEIKSEKPFLSRASNRIGGFTR
ncbi:MAG: hypothetical protein IJ400_05955 [Clostridia bacterium]|nr:hypothetical protein [Clostridia bacterium]